MDNELSLPHGTQEIEQKGLQIKTDQHVRSGPESKEE